MSWKTLESPGSNQRHLADRKIVLYQLSQILNYKTDDGSFVNFRCMTFQSTQKTTEDVDNGHAKECRSLDIDLHYYTFKIRFIRKPTAVHADAIAPGTRSCQTRTPSPFFLVREKGGYVRTLRTPLATCLGLLPGSATESSAERSVLIFVRTGHTHISGRRMRRRRRMKARMKKMVIKMSVYTIISS